MFKRRKRHQYVNSYFKPAASMKVNKIIQEAIPDKPHRNNSGMTDAEGLNKAYSAPNSIFMVIRCIFQVLIQVEMYSIGNYYL